MKAMLVTSSFAALACAVVCTPATAQETNILKNPSFETLNPEGMPSGWFSNANTSSGYQLEIDTQTPTDGENSIRLVSNATPESPFGNLAQVIDPAPFRGHRLMFSATVKAGTPTSQHLGLWFRVDKADGTTGFFDNMQRRPITDSKWQTYAIEGFVDPTATRITVGMIMVGRGEAWLDQARLTDVGFQPLEAAAAKQSRGPRLSRMAGDLGAAPLENRGKSNILAFARLYGLMRWFHPSDAALQVDWDALAISHLPKVEQASNAQELASVLREAFGPMAATLQIEPGAPDQLPAAKDVEGPLHRWQHFGLGGSSRVYRSTRLALDNPSDGQIVTEQLPGGVSFRLPLFASIEEEAATRLEGTGLNFDGKPANWSPSGHDRTTRLASTIVAWSTLAHFYPYWDEVTVDWQSELETALERAANAKDDREFHRVLQELVAEIDDGHGWVSYPSGNNAALPLDWQTIDGDLVVTAVADGVTDVEPGMIVTSIDGVPASEALAREGERMSGSDHYRVHLAERFIRFGKKGEEVELSVKTQTSGPETIKLTKQPTVQSASFDKLRPEYFSELNPGIFYIDLSRINQVDMDEALSKVTNAKGLVFDLRGYPRINKRWLARLTDRIIRSPNFIRPEFTGPDGKARFEGDGAWTIEPEGTRLTENVVFLTNASAISFSESILGTVKTNGLGTIVGSATAGANGNASDVYLPGGYKLRYTGMKVLNQDGSQHHLIGVTPDVAISPTREGVAQGRDEVLQAGLELVTTRAQQPPGA